MNGDNSTNSNKSTNTESTDMYTTPVSSPRTPSTPDTPTRRDVTEHWSDVNNSDVDLLDMDIPSISDIEIESPILARARAPQEPDTLELLGEDSGLDSDDPNDQYFQEMLQEEWRRRDAMQDQISTASESEDDVVRVPCPASPTRLREKAEWHPLPEDDEEEQDKYGQEDEAWEQGRTPDYAEGDPDESRHRWWKATIFSDYRDDSQREVCFAVEYFERVFNRLLLLAGLICAVMGIEICPKTHRIHAHLILGFSHAKKYSSLKKKLGDGQLRYLLTDDQIISWYDYVVKTFSKVIHPKKILRYGEGKVLNKKHSISRTVKRTHRDMFYENQQAIEEGRFDDIDPLFRFDHMSKIQKWYNDQHKAAIKVNHDRLVFIWGKPGVGKTSLFSRNIDPTLIYWKNPATKWWCGYRSQPIVIIDEVTPQQFQKGDINWNLIGDRNEIYVEVKGSQVPFQAQWVIVISNYSLDSLCSNRQGGLNETWKHTFKRRCGNETDGYRIYYFPENPPADNGDFADVSHRVYAIWKRKWYYDIKPFFNNIMNFPWDYYSVCYKHKRTIDYK